MLSKESEIGHLAAIGPAADPPHTKYDRLIARAKQVHPATTVVVHPCDETSLRGVVDAAAAGIIKPILVGPAAKIAATARQFGLDISRYEVVDVPHSDAAAATAVLRKVRRDNDIDISLRFRAIEKAAPNRLHRHGFRRRFSPPCCRAVGWSGVVG